MASSESDYDLNKEIENDSADTSKKSNRKRSKTESARRRTKTGCITCRQRRVKCDEQKPVCRNCDKSRRHCQGYKPIGSRQGSQPILPPYKGYSNHSSPNVVTPTQFIYEQQHMPFCNQSFDYIHQQPHSMPNPQPQPMIQNHLNMYPSADESWRYSMEGLFANQAQQWPASQTQYNVPAMDNRPYSLDFQIGPSVPALHLDSYPPTYSVLT